MAHLSALCVPLPFPAPMMSYAAGRRRWETGDAYQNQTRGCVAPDHEGAALVELSASSVLALTIHTH